MDRLFSSIEKLASNFSMSQTIRDYLSSQFVSFFYANLISGIFDNINKAKSGKHSLSIKEITAINRSYIEIRRKSKAGLSLSLKQHELIDETYYEKFKTDLIKQHSGCFQIVTSIEKGIDMNKARKYLMDRQNNLKSVGKPDTNLQAVLLTKEFEKHIESKNRIPTEPELSTMINRIFSKKSLDPYVENAYKNLKKSAGQVLEEQRTIRLEFEGRLYKNLEKASGLVRKLNYIFLRIWNGEEH